ncbi:MAG: hypothetical protein AB7P08_06225 [Burkholderiales bacterium]
MSRESDLQQRLDDICKIARSIKIVASHVGDNGMVEGPWLVNKSNLIISKAEGTFKINPEDPKEFAAAREEFRKGTADLLREGDPNISGEEISALVDHIDVAIDEVLGTYPQKRVDQAPRASMDAPKKP